MLQTVDVRNTCQKLCLQQLKRAESQVAPGDVEMPSAKMPDAAKKDAAVAGADAGAAGEEVLDAKARIKAAILNAGLRRKQLGISSFVLPFV